MKINFYASQFFKKVGQAKGLWLMLCMGLWITNTTAQTQMKRWTIPAKQLLFSTTGTPAASSLPITDAQQYASNCAYDKNGNLLFFVLDNSIYDAQGYLIDYLLNNGNFTALGPELAIVQRPSNCDQYYIIGNFISSTGAVLKPFYAAVSLTAANIYYPGRLGKLITNVTDLSAAPCPAGSLKDPVNAGSETNRFGIAVTPYRSSTGNYYLFLKGFNRNIERFIISGVNIAWDGSINYDPTQVYFPGPGDNISSNELEVATIGTSYYKLGFVFGRKNVGVVQLNYSNGTLSTALNSVKQITPVNTMYASVRGLEFSPNGDYLYYTQKNSSDLTQTIGYINTNTNAVTNMPNSTYPFANALGLSFIELAYDGKLYYNAGDRLLSVALNSDGTPNASTWTTAVTGLSTPQVLPDQMDGFVYTTPKLTLTSNTPNPICYGTTIQLCANVPYVGIWKNDIYTYTGLHDQCILTKPLQNLTYTITGNMGYCTESASYQVIVQRNNPNFTLNATSLSSSTDFTMNAVPVVDPYQGSGVGFYWEVMEVDANGAEVIGTRVTNPTSGCWWTPTNINNFFNYDYHTYYSNGVMNGCSSNVGKFLKGRRYKVTYGVWTASCTWQSISQTGTVCTTCKTSDGNNFVVEKTEISYEKPKYVDEPSVENKNLELNVSPNPSNGVYTIQLATDARKNISVYDVTGKLVFEKNNTSDRNISVDIASQPSGIYFLRVTVGEETLVQKLVIE